MEICSPNLMNFDYGSGVALRDMHQAITDALGFIILLFFVVDL